MLEVEVFRFHNTEPTIKKVMTLDEYKQLPNNKDYRYVSYQVGYNQTIIL